MTDSTPWRDRAVLRELYVDRRLSTREVAERLDTTKTTIRRWLNRHEIPIRPSPTEKPPWFGTDAEGYERWNVQVGEESYGVTIHRLAAVAWFGLDAVRERHVHHVDGLGWHNTESNITLKTAGQHAADHAEEMDRDEKGRFV